MYCNSQFSFFNEQSKDFWLNSFEQGLLIGEGDKETSGGYAEYIIKRLMEKFPHAKSEKLKK